MEPLATTPTSSKPSCIDLEARFGKLYHLGREADGVTWTSTPEAEQAWLLEIPCKYGVVYPQGGEILAAVVRGGRIQSKILALPGILTRRGDLELVVTFHVDDAEAVLGILRPRRRPRRSPEDIARRTTHMQRLNQERRTTSIGTVEKASRIDAGVKDVPKAQPTALKL